ncbi:MAG: hypothetical protein Aurels2KO_57070 [Aureliella sp.]
MFIQCVPKHYDRVTHLGPKSHVVTIAACEGEAKCPVIPGSLLGDVIFRFMPSFREGAGRGNRLLVETIKQPDSLPLKPTSSSFIRK